MFVRLRQDSLGTDGGGDVVGSVVRSARDPRQIWIETVSLRKDHP